MSPIIPDKILMRMNPAERAKLGKAGLTAAEALERGEARSERDLQQQIIAYLRLHGIECVLQPRMDRKSTINAGWPDLTFAVPIDGVLEGICASLRGPMDCAPYYTRGRRCHGCPVEYSLGCATAIPCAWEIKLPGKKPEAHQKTQLDAMAAEGWQTAVIHSIPEAKAELARLGITRD